MESLNFLAYFFSLFLFQVVAPIFGQLTVISISSIGGKNSTGALLSSQK